MIAVFKKEMRSYFTSVIGYVFMVLYLALAGAVFCYSTLFSMSADVTTFYTLMLIVSAIVLPLLTMKSFSEERKVKTEQLLLTSPVSLIGIVAGKFFAAYSIFASCMVVNSLYFLFLVNYASLKFSVLIGNLVAILLVGMVFIAIGLFVSSLTENQLSAAIGTIAIILAFLLIGVLSSLIPSSLPVRYVLDFISIFSRFQAFTAGYLDIAALIYYISVAFIFLYLTVRIYDRRRYN
ncbi:MAG: ABC transporter permease subunit [Clostridia bacterium]|nr:ABC transporter permease subunit [Clostridia bacterium]